MNSQDFGGKIVFKVRLDKEIKKIVIHNDDINYNEMLLMMQRIFAEKIKPNDEFAIKYTDEEGDLITLSNDSDVLLAIQTSKILKLTIFLKDKEEQVEELKPAEVVKELQAIRVGIDRFLERFERLVKLDVKRTDESSAARTPAELKAVNGGASTGLPLIRNDAHREFDPLNKRTEPDGIHHKGSRAGSPDSISSSTDVRRFEQPPQLNGGAAISHVTPVAHPPQQIAHPQPQAAPAALHPQQQQFQQAPAPQAFQQPALQRPAQPGFQPAPVVNQVAPPGQLYQPPAPQQQQQQPQQQQQHQFSGAGVTGPVDHHQVQALGQNFAPQQPQQQLQQQAYGQYMPQGPQQQLPGAFPQTGLGSPQQPQQQQQPAYQQQQQPGQQMPPMGGLGGANPFSKSGHALARPPSATLYQQGYK